MAALVKASCIDCHDAGTETGLNFETLGDDLADAKTFRMWERVYDRVHDGEMPPKSEARPDAEQLKSALEELRNKLQAASQSMQRSIGRVPARRLTKLELGYTIRDLLLIDSDVTDGVPEEVEAGSFDTVGRNQRISAVHMASYLQAADKALGLAIKLGRNPRREGGVTDYGWLDEWHEKPVNLGGSITRRLQFGNGVALFRDVDYLTQFRFGVSVPGIHRISAKVAAYQSKDPVTAKVIVKNQSGSAALVLAIDLKPGDPQTISVDTFLKPGDSPYLTFDMRGEEPFGAIAAAGGSKNYKGRGLAILSQRIEGPLFDAWPPTSSRQLLHGLELKSKSGSEAGPFEIKASKDQLDHVTEIVTRFAPLAFRRPVAAEEVERFVALAAPAIKEGRDLLDVLQIPLRSILTSPQFLMFAGEPGELDPYALASRLSYFLWKSIPDDELLELAAAGTLSDPAVMRPQVDRMLADEKSSRFVRDFVGQWLRLSKINATTPDAGLYPEFDELLSNAIPQETELYFANLIEENLSLSLLIDSDFTFVNRRLAEHYGIEGVAGQEFRKVTLPDDSPRGGVLTQAAVLKTTANGTTTSPVTRGNFVLTNFLGTPPSPPPPGVGSIEPDTRGHTTVRSILEAHREIDSCNQCHREIDPPGFAMECFDPIGGFRTNYRASGGELKFGDFVTPAPYKQGPPVDASGMTADGKKFSGIRDFKQHLLEQKDQVALNFVSKLVEYATGGEIQFADRDDIEAILQRTSDDDFPVRTLIHEVVLSKMFRNQ